MTDKRIKELEAELFNARAEARTAIADSYRMGKEAQCATDAKVIKAAEDNLVERLKALQTYFDLSDEELESMTRDEKADTIRQHGLISKALAAFRQAQSRAALKEKTDDP